MTFQAKMLIASLPNPQRVSEHVVEIGEGEEEKQQDLEFGGLAGPWVAILQSKGQPLAGHSFALIHSERGILLQARVNGRVARKGQVRAWTEGKVAHVALGSGDAALAVDGVVGRVNLATNRNGRVVRRDIAGTIPGVLTFQGQSYTLPLGAAPALPAELAQLVKIETGVTERIRRGLKVTALRITVLDGSAAGTVVNLGNARASARGR